MAIMSEEKHYHREARPSFLTYVVVVLGLVAGLQGTTAFIFLGTSNCRNSRSLLHAHPIEQTTKKWRFHARVIDSSSNNVHYDRGIFGSPVTTVQQRRRRCASGVTLRRGGFLLFLSTTNNDDKLSTTPSDEELLLLQRELKEYLALREKVGADELAKEEIGKVVGGTKGNVLLEYVSAAPNKPTVTNTAPNPLDYDELTKYGYGHLVTRIMNAGGRIQMYSLLGLTPPPPSSSTSLTTSVSAPILLNQEDNVRGYQGLKLGQAFDDEMQAAALMEYQRKKKEGMGTSRSSDTTVGSSLSASDEVWQEVASFERPFADAQNIGPKQTPDWTAEQLDEWGKQQGRVESWARQAKLNAYIQDPNESWDTVHLYQRLWAYITAIGTALAFGQSSPTMIRFLFGDASATGDAATTTVDPNVLSVLQLPALMLLMASLGSAVYCALNASSQNRSTSLWTVKGFFGGPFTVRQLASLPTLVTQQEKDEQDQQQQEDSSQSIPSPPQGLQR